MMFNSIDLANTLSKQGILEIHIKEGSLVWGVLGEVDRANQELS